jgi:hypothetical protein
MSLPNLSSPIPATSSSCSVRPGSAQPQTEQANRDFVDRRNSAGNGTDRLERRQFGSLHAGLSDEGRELALAIDQYKIQQHRRYLTCDDMLKVLASLGYAKRS